MAQQRNVHDKIADANTAFNVFRELLTSDTKRAVLDDMTDQQRKAAAADDINAYAALVQSSLLLDRVISANDRAALIAAVMATQSGISRPQLDISEEQL